MANNAGNKETNPPSESIQLAQEDEGDKQAEMQLLDPNKKKEKSKKKMTSKKKSSANKVAGGGDSSMFGLTLEQLKSLMELRGKDLLEKLNSSDYNGVKGILEKLKVDGDKGLDSSNEQDLEQRRTAYGRNEIPPKPMKSFLGLCWEAFHDPLVLFLSACAVISIALSFYRPPEVKGQEHEDNMEWLEGIGILVAVFIVVLVAALVDYKKERQFRGLQDKVEKDHLASVVRDNHIQQIPISDLVVGDLCFIKYGDLLPADGILVQASDLKMDESSLTGETDLIKKNENDDVGLLSGTQAMEGSGRMVVLGVGLNSQVGVIMGLLGATEGTNQSKDKKKDKKDKSDKEKDASRASKAATSAEGGEEHQLLAKNETKSEDDGDKKKKGKKDKKNKKEEAAATATTAATTTATPLEESAEDDEGGASEGKNRSVIQMKLGRLVLYISYVGVAAAVLTLICLVLRFCILTYAIEKQSFSGQHISYFISFVIQAITVMVVAIPEGLSLAVTLALAFAVQKMLKDNNLVRHLYACETMGNATTICSDKTGTLTTNRMTVVQSYLNGKHSEQLPQAQEINQDILPLLFEAVSVNSGYTSKIEKSKDDAGLPKQVGNKTECALLDLVLKWGGSYEDIRRTFPESRLVKVYTFNSARKMMSVIIQRDDGYRLYTKGASEMVLTKCKSILGEDNQPKGLDDHEKERLTHEVIEKMAHDGLRTICISYKDLGKDQLNWDDEEKIINDLICIAIVGIEDPVRKEVPEAIAKCQRAGVVVRMVTGDNVMTARSIATKCGILKPDDDFLVLEGKEFNKRIRDESGKISQKKLDEVWPNLRVLARSSPQDKYNLVNGIVESHATENREVVAVTGDGTNDGPALKRADVGFAMGIQGTDVAREASDIVLTDDNFSSIVKALMWGRNVYDCIAKFLQFQLTANLSAGVLSVISAAAISTVPLRALQMLWVNLVMDTLASLALATEVPTDDLLNRKPYGRTKSIISPLMIRNIVGQSIYQLTVMFVILYAGHLFLDVESTVDAIQHNPHAARELSEQFTLVFNAFVLMTLFNEINARKLHGERNVFKGILRNPFFYGIWLLCFVGQVLIITFGGRVMSCARLNIFHWSWSLIFGFGSLIWQQILLCIPVDPFVKCFSAMYRVICPCCYKRDVQKRVAEEERRKSMAIDPSRRISRKSVGGDGLEYSTIMQLTNATVVAEPPPIFARYMLRKSVDRLNTEFRVISEFRSRLEEIKDKKYEEAFEIKRSSRGNILEE